MQKPIVRSGRYQDELYVDIEAHPNERLKVTLNGHPLVDGLVENFDKGPDPVDVALADFGRQAALLLVTTGEQEALPQELYDTLRDIFFNDPDIPSDREFWVEQARDHPDLVTWWDVRH